MEITFQQHFMTGFERLDTDLRDLEILQNDAGTCLYAATGRNGGISQFRLDGAAPSLQDVYWHQGSTLATGEFSLAAIGGETHLLQHNSVGSRLLSYQVGSDGDLASQSAQSLTGGTVGGSVGAAAVAELNGAHSVVYSVTEAGQSTGQLTGWRLDAAGRPQAEVSTAGGDSAYQLSGAVALEVSDEAGLLFVADAAGQGLHSFRINAQTGALQAADSFTAADGLPVSSPSALQSFTAYDSTWVILSAAGTGSLSLFRVADSGANAGTLNFVDQVSDTLATRFGGASALEVVSVGDHVLVLAAGADDGLTLLQLLPSGQLLHLRSLSHEAGLGLENVSALESVMMGDALEIYVSSGSEMGISRFTLDLSELGLVETATRGTLRGSAGDDLLEGGTGTVTLLGQAGDDVLVARGAGSVLTGGNGADCFALGAVRGQIRVTDFQPGEDSLDLSLIPGLYGPGQLTVANLNGGIRLSFGVTEILVRSASGAELTLADIWPTGGFSTPSRVALGQSFEDDMQYGTGDKDLLQGTGGADSLQGLGGEDRLNGLSGADQLWGGDGDDQVKGGGGNDSLYGELGADLLAGGGGADWLFGGAGDDLLKGNSGNDTLEGGIGADRLKGGGGNDQLFGGEGFDFLFGGGGHDLLVAGAGPSRLLGNGGNDTLKGDAQADVLKGGGGADRLLGFDGDDRLDGGKGRDSFSGGDGADVFIFEKGHGRDVILDFTPETDQLDFSGIRGLDYEDLEILRRGEDTLIQTGAGQIRLEDLRPAELSVDDFIF
ncbi:calcium-binding protein [Pseudophaeobacter leonis]|uniref:calcium-binding protein n=1 Tax=Pseudophaeobacter leonis TaxID=1144477 RepID=UPI0009F56127|nr:calcium-binding protein [Pseudophaeobacter leonis]